MTSPAPITTPLQHLTTRYNADELTRAEYRDALKALYARETDPQQMAKICVLFVGVSMVAS